MNNHRPSQSLLCVVSLMPFKYIGAILVVFTNLIKLLNRILVIYVFLPCGALRSRCLVLGHDDLSKLMF